MENPRLRLSVPTVPRLSAAEEAAGGQAKTPGAQEKETQLQRSDGPEPSAYVRCPAAAER